MSTDLAITAVTRTLRQILSEQVEQTWDPAVPSPNLTQQLVVDHVPPHKVRDLHQAKNVLNLYLYRTELNAAWRNMPLPTQAKPGEPVTPPLALNLEYLLTSYGEDDREDASHYFLGQAMRVLHDLAVVPRGKFKDVLEVALVHQQIEQVTITPKPLSVEEISKLWSVFQSQFRISAAYLVTVLLLESRKPAKSALPVLKRGPDDSGVTAIAGALPLLDSAKPASGFLAARLGETIVLAGQRLDMFETVAQLRHPTMSAAIEVAVVAVDASHVQVTLPEALGGSGVARGWPAGLYSIALSGTLANGVHWSTNSVSFALAPSITVAPTTQPAGPDFEVTLEATPQIGEGQSVVILFGNRQLAATSITQPGNDDDPTAITFDAPGQAGLSRVRLRVDGVDSIPIVATDGKFEFDPDQSIQVE